MGRIKINTLATILGITTISFGIATGIRHYFPPKQTPERGYLAEAGTLTGLGCTFLALGIYREENDPENPNYSE